MEIVPFNVKHACMFATCKADRACRVQRNLKKVPYFEELSVLPMVYERVFSWRDGSRGRTRHSTFNYFVSTLYGCL